MVFVAATASDTPRKELIFLSVDFEEKLYAVGRIPEDLLKGRPSY